jgi:uncharacterized membrane protein
MSSANMVPRTTPVPLFVALLVYCAASLVHFVHNAEFLHEYPNMPEWLTRLGVYAAWIAVTVVGVTGFAIYKLRAPRTGLVLLALYAALGYAGLDHYVVAPASAHTFVMNATIAFEVVTATILLWIVARMLLVKSATVNPA